MILSELMEYAGEAGALKVDDFDDCVIGVAERCSQSPLLVYDTEKIIATLVDREGMSWSDAQEFVSFNITGAWMGDGTPLFMTLLEVVDKKEGNPPRDSLFSKIVDTQTK